ncbi:MAG: ABC transporter permease, partial [Mesorhizobium sp.]
AAAIWPTRFRRATPYLMLLPAVLLVGLLVLGLIQITDASLRTLDTTTFRFSDDYSIANFRRALTEPLFLVVAQRSLVAALIVTVVTLVFAFPYAYLMVRTRSPGLRKFLLIALFLPF